LISKADKGTTVDPGRKRSTKLVSLYIQRQNNLQYLSPASGDDDWDPMAIKPIVVQWENDNNRSPGNLPVQLNITTNTTLIETKKNEATLTASPFAFW
jgi:hypothetical protein